MRNITNIVNLSNLGFIVMPKKVLAILISIFCIINLAYMVEPIFSHNFSGTGIKLPEHILIIFKQRIVTIPIITIVLAEFFLIVLLISIRQGYLYLKYERTSIKVRGLAKALMILGILIVPSTTVLGYGVVMAILINGDLKPTVSPEITPSKVMTSIDEVSFVYGSGDAFYGPNYVSVFYELYEVAPIEGKIWPAPLIYGISLMIFLGGLVLFMIISRWKKN